MSDNINKAVEKAIQIAGSQGKLSAALGGYAQSAIWKCLHNKLKVPPELVPEIVEITGGQVQGHELRPDLPKLFPPPPG